jgi:hypothetical protein
MVDLLEHLRNHLVTAGVARVPAVAGDLPPMWNQPRRGVPAPGEGDNPVEVGAHAVLGAFVTGGIAPKPYEAFLRRDTVDIWFRVDLAPLAFDLEQQVRKQLIDKRDWLMDGLRIVECLQWRPLQPLGSDDQAFDFNVSYIFELFAE